MIHRYKGQYYRRLCKRTAEPSQKGDKNQCVCMGKQLPIEQDIDADLSLNPFVLSLTFFTYLLSGILNNHSVSLI